MLPLLGEALRIDVGVPDHQRGHQRVRHSAGRQANVAETAVTQIRLAHTNVVARLAERAGVVSKSHVCGTRVRARFKTQAEEPIVHECAAQAETEPVTFAAAFQRVVRPGRAGHGVRRCSLPLLVAHSHVAVQFDLIDRRRNFPFPSRGRGCFPRQLASHFLRLLVGDQFLLHEQVEQRSGILRARGKAAKGQAGGHGD